MEDDFHSYYNNKYDDEDDDFEEEEEDMEEEEEEEEEEDEGYPYPIGPMPQEIYNDLRSLDEMVRNNQECEKFELLKSLGYNPVLFYYINFSLTNKMYWL